MEDIYNRKLSIYLTAGYDDDGKEIVKSKSFSNIRLDSTDEEMTQFRDKFIALSDGTHQKSVVADYRML